MITTTRFFSSSPMNNKIFSSLLCVTFQTHIIEFMEKTFQGAQLTHERFLTIHHSCKIFFDVCQTELPQTFGV